MSTSVKRKSMTTTIKSLAKKKTGESSWPANESGDSKCAAMAYRAEFEAKRKPRAEGKDTPSLLKPATTLKPSGAPSAQTKPAAGVSPHPAILPSTIPQSVETPIDTSQMSDEELCAWHNCTRGPGGGRAVRRKNSKYCSRACSNANARWRFKQRKKDGDD